MLSKLFRPSISAWPGEELKKSFLVSNVAVDNIELLNVPAVYHRDNCATAVTSKALHFAHIL
jgi:hypothetical protein